MLEGDPTFQHLALTVNGSYTPAIFAGTEGLTGKELPAMG